MKQFIYFLFPVLLTACGYPEPGLQDPCSGWVIFNNHPACYDMSLHPPTCGRIKPSCFCECPEQICRKHTIHVYKN